MLATKSTSFTTELKHYITYYLTLFKISKYSMSLPVTPESLKLEADATSLRIQASITEIKNTQFPSRKAANQAIQLHHASLQIPKHLIAEDNYCGRRVTLRCSDDNCSVKVSIDCEHWKNVDNRDYKLLLI